MRKIIALVAAGVTLATLAAGPAWAQTADEKAAIDAARNQVTTACSVPPVDAAACSAQVDAFLLALSVLPPRVADNARADLINVLAATSTGATRAIISQALTTVANSIADSTRREAALQIAGQVASGVKVTIVLAAQASAN